jgi:3-oxoacyl-[acyl-carrier-protein] synthase II
MSKRRAVITGIGIVSPLGNDRETTTFSGLLDGANGIGMITSFDASAFSTKIAGEVRNFDPAKYVEPKEVRRLDRFTLLTAAAGLDAMQDSGLDMSKEDPDRCGVICGSGIGGLSRNRSAAQDPHGARAGSRQSVPHPEVDDERDERAPSMRFGLKGQNWVTASACARRRRTESVTAPAESHSVRRRRRRRRHGRVGSGDYALGIAGYCSLGAMSTRNERPESAEPAVRSRPRRFRDG